MLSPKIHIGFSIFILSARNDILVSTSSSPSKHTPKERDVNENCKTHVENTYLISMSLEGCYIIILVGHPRYGTSFNGDKYESHVKKSVKSFLSQKEKRKKKKKRTYIYYKFWLHRFVIMFVCWLCHSFPSLLELSLQCRRKLIFIVYCLFFFKVLYLYNFIGKSVNTNLSKYSL